MIYSKESYTEQYNKLIERSYSKLTVKDFEDIYLAAQGGKKIKNIDMVIEKIVNELFKMPYMTESLVPWNFIKSPIGEIVSIVTFGLSLRIDEIVFANELAELTGFSVQHISQEIKRGNINAYQKPNGVWLIEEDEANRYLAKKNKPTVKELKKEG